MLVYLHEMTLIFAAFVDQLALYVVINVFYDYMVALTIHALQNKQTLQL